MNYKTTKIQIFASALLVTVLCLPVSNADAGRRKPRPQREIILPKLQQVSDNATARVVTDGTVTGLMVPGSTNDATIVLKRLFKKLNISFNQKDKTSHTIITGWIRFIYDPEKNKVYYKKRSRHPLERHRFRIIIKSAAQTDKALIVVRDQQRQVEIDLAPDSMASFLEWRDRPVQPGAATAFTRYLQGRYDFASMAILKRKPATHLKTRVIRQRNKPAEIVKKTAVVPKKKHAAKGMSQATNNSNLEITASRTVRKAAAAPKMKSTVNNQSPATSNMGLEITASLETVWKALQQSLKRDKVTYKILDDQQYTLKTDWLHYSWNNKTRTLRRGRSGAQWTRSSSRSRKQQHQFIITVSPGKNKTVSVIAASHTGHQQYIDKWPDSTASFYQWEDRPLQAVIAESFLQHLNLALK